MKTPLFDAVDAYVKKDAARFHMPGHKGQLAWMDLLLETGGIAKYDVTEADGCDSLYLASSCIAETERRYKELYQSAASFLSAGGSTLCIQTMLALAVKPGETLICGRGCHASAINAMALLDISPEWIFPGEDAHTSLANPITAAQVGEALEQNPDTAAVYLTSPDYYGVICDIASVSKVCRKHGVPLLVDSAHGAHLRFFEPSRHPINLGADMCADSLHKTLPVLTGGAMLHIQNEKYIADAKKYMSIFGSTSPSYLIMLSADKALESLCGDFPEALRQTSVEVEQLENIARNAGFLVPKIERDPVKLTLGFSRPGCDYDADDFMRLARENGIEPEMAGGGFAVFMASPKNSKEDFERLKSFIIKSSQVQGNSKSPKKESVSIKLHDKVFPKRVVGLREAALAKSHEIPLDAAVGKIAGSVVTVCPPAIPLVVPGELIDEKLMLYLKKYGILHINVLK